MDARVTRTIERMEQRLRELVSIERLATEVGLSQSRLGYLFRRETGMSPRAYLNALRMNRARLLIERTTLSVLEIMAQVGIVDPSHFARDFRTAHGSSPRAYRLELRRAGTFAGGTAAPADGVRITARDRPAACPHEPEPQTSAVRRR